MKLFEKSDHSTDREALRSINEEGWVLGMGTGGF